MLFSGTFFTIFCVGIENIRSNSCVQSIFNFFSNIWKKNIYTYKILYYNMIFHFKKTSMFEVLLKLVHQNEREIEIQKFKDRSRINVQYMYICIFSKCSWFLFFCAKWNNSATNSERCFGNYRWTSLLIRVSNCKSHQPRTTDPRFWNRFRGS